MGGEPRLADGHHIPKRGTPNHNHGPLSCSCSFSSTHLIALHHAPPHPVAATLQPHTHTYTHTHRCGCPSAARACASRCSTLSATRSATSTAMSRQARSRCPRGGNQRSSRACRCVGWGGMRRHVCRHPCVEVVELAQQRRAECWQDRVWTPSVGEGWPDWACRIGHGLGCWAEKEAGSRCCVLFIDHLFAARTPCL
eukprot:1158165-Pelagomonas_calceolata.AAC.11